MYSRIPSVSVLIPTLNAALVLEGCLRSIREQNYPKEKIEIIIADGGSIDSTLAIARKYQAKVSPNPLRTAEAGKAVALKQSRNELAALIDSDNVLPEKNWLRKMVFPFKDRFILGSEPWEFTYRRKDSLINRYCALIGVNDPYCYFVGNYDKRSFLSGKWTGLKIEEKDQGQYLRVWLKGEILPTIGANGTIWRTKVLKEVVGSSEYLIDTDIPYALVEEKPLCFAKVKVGIIHLYCQRVKDFYRKQRRRVKDFYYLEGQKKRKVTYQRQILKQIGFILSSILVFPLVIHSVKGYIKKPDRAWFFHPVGCLITLWIYSTESILARFERSPMDRVGWKQ